MTILEIRRDYGVRRRLVYAMIASGELFVACGAARGSVRVDFRPGGEFRTSALSGTYRRVTSDSVEVALADGSRAELTVAGDGDSGSVRAVLHDADAAARDRWAAGLAALAPPPGRADAESGERLTYEDYLDVYRAAVPGKLRGVSESDARRPLVGSATTLLGLVRHLTGVERHWYHVIVAGTPRAEVGPNNRGSADSWQLGPQDTVASVLGDYAAVCAESRRIAVRHELAAVFPRDTGGPDVSLRTVHVHMIEETARHAGHADILRELLDGSTGDHPSVLTAPDVPDLLGTGDGHAR